MHLAGEKSWVCECLPAIRHMHHVDASHHFEQLAVDVRCASIAGRGHVDPAGVRLGIVDELRDGLGCERRMYLHHTGRTVDARDRCYIADEIEIEFVVKWPAPRI